MKRILAATDGSENSLVAVETAAELAAGLDAELDILAVGALTSIAGDEGWEAYMRAEHLRGGLSELLPIVMPEHLDEARRRALDKGAKRVRTATRVGDPATQIMEQIRDDASDLVVVGSRGRGRMAGLLLGSVSQKLASLAPCPVLIVRSPEAAKPSERPEATYLSLP